MMMPNNEHLPNIRTYPADIEANDPEMFSWQCSCGYIDPHLWGGELGAVESWLDHVLAESLRLAKLDDRYDATVDLTES